jgi:2-C-methyl-D-erythritol 4-phosphate cytidylyltransferase
MEEFKKYVIIVAGGSGSRMNAPLPKQFISIGGKTVLQHTIEKFYTSVPNIEIIVVLPENEIARWVAICKSDNINISHRIVKGGATRFDSVKNGLESINDIGVVAVHDGVRPFVTSKAILDSFHHAYTHGNAVLAVPLKDSIRRKKDNDTIAEPRSDFFLIQTPQTFEIGLLKRAYQTTYQSFFTDDASVVEYSGTKIELIEGNDENIKITTPNDLLIAEAIVQKQLKNNDKTQLIYE